MVVREVSSNMNRYRGERPGRILECCIYGLTCSCDTVEVANLKKGAYVTLAAWSNLRSW